MIVRRQESGSNAMVTVQMTVEEYLEMKSRQETKEVATKQKNLVYGLEGIKTLLFEALPPSKFYHLFDQKCSGKPPFLKILNTSYGGGFV